MRTIPVGRRRKMPWASGPATALLLAAGCVHGASAPAPQAAAPPPRQAQDFLVRSPSFTRCELEGFIALGAARNAFALHVSKDAMLAATKPPERRALIEELYALKEAGTLRNHASFAEQKFYECTDAEGLPIEKKPGGAAVCLARLDIVFYLDSYREEGGTEGEVLARFRRAFARSPKDVYPDALAEKLVPMVFGATTHDDNYALRRLVFETCLFPDEWKAWWNAGHPER